MFKIVYDYIDQCYRDLVYGGDYSEFEQGAEFRLIDDDNEKMYKGFLSKKLNENSVDGFIPLDEYGEFAGATSIQYLINGTWETL